MKCSSCGNETPSDSQFCGACGSSLGTSTSSDIGIAASERPWYKNSALQIVLAIALALFGLPIVVNVLARPSEDSDPNFDQSAGTETSSELTGSAPLPAATAMAIPRIRGLSHFEQCGEYGYADNRSKALESCTKFIDLNPDSTEWEIIEAYEIRGFTHEGLNRYEEATDEYEQAIKLEPAQDVKLRIYERLGNAYLHFGVQTYESDTGFALAQFERAIETGSKVLELEPENEWPYSLMGEAYHRLGQYQHAIDNWERLLELNPNDHQNYTNAGNAYKRLTELTDDQNLLEKALKNFDKALKLNPGDEGASQMRI